MEGSFIIKKLVNKRGVYAHVQLDVHRVPGGEIEIDVSNFTQWRTAVTFGANYFFNRYSRTEKGGLKITILYLHDMAPFDTNNMIVFFAVVQALSQALGMRCDVTLDDAGNFIIPR